MKILCFKLQWKFSQCHKQISQTILQSYFTEQKVCFFYLLVFHTFLRCVAGISGLFVELSFTFLAKFCQTKILINRSNKPNGGLIILEEVQLGIYQH